MTIVAAAGITNLPFESLGRRFPMTGTLVNNRMRPTSMEGFV